MTERPGSDAPPQAVSHDERGVPGIDPSPAGTGEPAGTALVASRPKRRGFTGTVLVPLVIALVVVALIRTFLVTTFSIEGSSMEHTLESGDRVFVTRSDIAGTIERGDIVVFDATAAYSMRSTPDTLADRLAAALGVIVGRSSDTDHVKRVIGVAGDHVVCCDESGRMTLNGTVIDEPYVYPGDQASDSEFDVTVPAGRLWVLGDHRSVSSDSRAHVGGPGGGLVPVEDVIGKVQVRYWPPTSAGLVDP